MTGCAADTGGPQRGVAGDALGQLLVAHDVRERQPSAGAQRPRGCGEYRRFFRGEVDHAVGDHAVESAIVERWALDVACAELDLREAGLVGESPRLGELLVGHVDVDDPPVRAGPSTRNRY